MDNPATTQKGAYERVTTEHLERLGYRVTSRGILNEKKGVKIMELERIDDGTEPDFVFCTHADADFGIVVPHKLCFYVNKVCLKGRDV